METRVAVIAVIVENEDAVAELNALLHQYGMCIIGRMGVPYRARGVNIISVVLDAPQEAPRRCTPMLLPLYKHQGIHKRS